MAPRPAWFGGGRRLRLGAAASLALLTCPSTTDAQPAVTPRADLLAAVGAEARDAVAATTTGRDARTARLAEALARRGAIDEARETARQLATSWVPYARVAIVQRAGGDLAGALATARLAPGFTDRAQAIGYLASAYAYSGDYDRALEITRVIEWPKQRVEELRLVAQELRRRDVERARALLVEAVAVARADSSHWGRYFEVELAYEQAAVGDLEGARRLLPDTLPARLRAERLGRMVAETRRMPEPRAAATADSLFRAALRAADAVPDSATRARVRARVLFLNGVYGDTMATQSTIRESRSAAERTAALARDAAVRAFARTDVDGALRTAAELERAHAFREAASTFASILTAQGGRSVTHRGPRPPEPSSPTSDTLALRAVANAARVSPAFADSMRLRVVEYLIFLDASRARALAREIGDERLRARAMLLAGTHSLHDDPRAAAAYAALMPPSAERDALFLRAAQRLAQQDPEAAPRVVREIGSAALRAHAMASVAGAFLMRADSARARALYEESLALADPITHGTGEAVVGPLQALGELPRLRAWARSQPTPERRAEAAVLVLETLPP